MGYKNYLKLDARQKNLLYRHARKGDKVAQATLVAFTRQLADQANKRLRELEKAELNYYKAYNSASYFLFTEYEGGTRFKRSTIFLKNNDWDAIELQNRQAEKFLNSSLSTVKGVREAETRRIEILHERGIITDDIIDHKSKGYLYAQSFLRFLGSEEVRATVDEYGTSDVVVEYLYSAFRKGQNTIFIQRALAEFLDNQITFDEAMERIGIKIEDYNSRRATS